MGHDESDECSAIYTGYYVLTDATNSLRRYKPKRM
jgi:hypothetical protein